VVFCISLLLIIASQKYKTYLFILLLLLLSIAQTYPLYFGMAVKGENIDDKYYDRIAKIGYEYKDVADKLNKDKSNNVSYVFTTPSVAYGVYSLNYKGTDHLVGQDLLPKLINKPFIYLSSSSGIDSNVSKQLFKVITDENYDELKKFPIEYIILRKDINCLDCPILTKENLDNNYLKILENNLFIVYKVNEFTPLINVKGSTLKYEMVSPVMFKVNLENIKNQAKLNLMLSFNKNWHIYLDKNDKTNKLLEKNLFNRTHKYANDYANSWIIDTNYIKQNFSKNNYTINKDGTLNFKVIVYYTPQNWYYFYAFISTFLLTVYLLILLRKHKDD